MVFHLPDFTVDTPCTAGVFPCSSFEKSNVFQKKNKKPPKHFQNTIAHEVCKPPHAVEILGASDVSLGLKVSPRMMT